MPSLDSILTVILAGGKGSRLYPLTKLRSKPAVPLGGKYRLIDIPISNCINSGLFRIAVLTQFNSVSLNRHISQTYVFDVFHTGSVYIWAAEQTIENADWYQGSADAVRKQLFQIRSAHADYVLVLAGDHLYRMDYSEMARFHWDHDADITVAVQPVRPEEASRLGLLKRDEDCRIVRFAEKPKDPALLAEMVTRDDPAMPYLGSMGIYMFKTQALIDVLEQNAFDDFGAQVIPHALSKSNVFGYDFEGYWVDIGTIRSFYETNLALTDPNPRFNLYDPDKPMFSHSRFLPGSIITNCILEHVLLCDGSFLNRSEIRHSIVGVRSRIHSGAVILDTVLMGSDYYDQGCQNEEDDDSPMPCIGIGRDCFIQGAIVDKNARIGRNVTIKPFPRGTDLEGENWVVQDGIVVIPKNAVLLPGTVIAPK